MWIFLEDAFLSIVQKPEDKSRGTLTVRSRFAGDIQRAFPEALVQRGGGTDYPFRATVHRYDVAMMLRDRAWSMDYDNFKDTVAPDRKPLYLRVWEIMGGFDGWPLAERTRKRRARK